MNEPLRLFADISECMCLQWLIILPLAAGLLLFAVPDKFLWLKGLLALAVSLVTGYLTAAIYTASPMMTAHGDTVRQGYMAILHSDLIGKAGDYLTFNIDGLSKLIILFISIVSRIISNRYQKHKIQLKILYSTCQGYRKCRGPYFGSKGYGGAAKALCGIRTYYSLKIGN